MENLNLASLKAAIDKYSMDLSEYNASEAIEELNMHESEWENCRDMRDYKYDQIVRILGYGYFLLKMYKESIESIENGLTRINEDFPDYRHKAKENLYEILGHDYCFLEEKEKAVEAFRKMVYYYTFSIGNVSYSSISLFSFRQASIYCLSDLKNNTLSLNSIFSFNDPVDSAFFPWIEKQLETETENAQILFLEAMKEAFSGYRARCFVTEKPLPTEREKPRLPYDTIKPYQNTIMWSHYADYHKGICAEYNIPTSAVTAHPKEGYAIAIHPINYVDTMPFDANYNFKKGFLTKSKRWEYEHEVRLFYYSSSLPLNYPVISLDDHPYNPKEPPQKALKAIYLGYKCDKKEEIINLIKSSQPQAKIYQMRLSDDDIYSLVPELVYEGKDI